VGKRAEAGIRLKEEVNTNAIDWLYQNGNRQRSPIPTHIAWNLDVGNYNNDNGVEEESNDSFRHVRVPDMSGLTQNYWLQIGDTGLTTQEQDKPYYYRWNKPGTIIHAWLDKANNKVAVTITVSASKKEQVGVQSTHGHVRHLRVLLRPGMLDLSKQVSVQMVDQVVTVEAKQPPSQPVVLQSVALDAGTRGSVEVKKVIKDTLARNDPNLVFVADIVLTRGKDGKWAASAST